jgi:hypothetical protein
VKARCKAMLLTDTAHGGGLGMCCTQPPPTPHLVAMGLRLPNRHHQLLACERTLLLATDAVAWAVACRHQWPVPSDAQFSPPLVVKLR